MPPISMATGRRIPDAADLGVRRPWLSVARSAGHRHGLLTRFVGINLLFTTSPLYDPLVTAPGPGGRKIGDITMFEDDPASSGVDWMNPDFAKQGVAAASSRTTSGETGFADVDPIDSGAKNALDTFSGLSMSRRAAGRTFGTPARSCSATSPRTCDIYVPEYRPNATTWRRCLRSTPRWPTSARSLGLLGFADDNWVDGTQSFVFTFDAAEYRELGLRVHRHDIHEVGSSHRHVAPARRLRFRSGPRLRLRRGRSSSPGPATRAKR